MSRYLAVKEHVGMRVSRVSGAYEYAPLPMISKQLQQGWFLYREPMVERGNIYAIQFFIKNPNDVAKSSDSFSEYICVTFHAESKGIIPATEVNTKLAEGWKLYGSPFHGGSEYVQVMVKPTNVSRSIVSSMPTDSPTSSTSNTLPSQWADIPRLVEKGGKTRRLRKRI